METSSVKEVIAANIMVGERIGFGEGKLGGVTLTAETATETAEDLIDGFLVHVQENAASACVDGRSCAHTLANTFPQAGPKLAGGALMTAFAAAETVTGYYGEQSATAAFGRLQEVGAVLAARGIDSSAHTTESAVAAGYADAEGNPKTGCGAGESFSKSTKIITEGDLDVDRTVAGLQIYTREQVSLKPAAELAATDQGFRCDDVLKVAPDQNVEVLAGVHAEQLIAFNYAEGTTIDRDAYVAATGKQVFTVDMWYIDKVAHALADGRPDFETMYPALLYAMTAFQVATYKSLCDGTHWPVVIKPEAASL